MFSQQQKDTADTQNDVVKNIMSKDKRIQINSENIRFEEVFLNELEPFPNHKFKPMSDEQFEELVKSVKENGIMQAIVVWEKDGSRKIILSGHNRVNAAKEAGCEKIKAEILTDLTNDQAEIIVIDTNLLQRSFESMSVSEKVYAINTKYDLLKSELPEDAQGNTMDKFVEAEKDNIGLSAPSIAVYRRLKTLTPELMGLLDDKELSLEGGSELSYIDDSSTQEAIADLIKNGELKGNKSQMAKIREEYQMNREPLDEDGIKEIFKRKEKAKRGKRKMTLPIRLLDKFSLLEKDEKEVIGTIEDALDQYYEILSSLENNDVLFAEQIVKMAKEEDEKDGIDNAASEEAWKNG